MDYKEIERSIIKKYRKDIWSKFVKAVADYELIKENDSDKLDEQETIVKLMISKMIMNQLLNEVIEILEHVQLNRKKPELYQNKSIYACDEIPRLSFQMISNNSENDETEADVVLSH